MSARLAVVAGLLLAMSAAALPALERLAARELGRVLPALEPEGLEARPGFGVDAERRGESYHLRARFRGPRGRTHVWTWRWPAERADADMARYGVPASLFEPYRSTPEVERARAARIRAGLFRQTESQIAPDRPRIVRAYAPYQAPLLELSRRVAGRGARPRIELLLALLQDLAYGIPPEADGDRYLGGILPAPRAFLEGWGDCDTKAFALAGAARGLGLRALLLRVPGHLLLGVEVLPRPYDRVHRHRGRRYVLAEPAGPGRLALGRPHRPYPSFVSVEALDPRPPAEAIGEAEANRVTAGEVWLASAAAEPGAEVIELGLKPGLRAVALAEVDGERLPRSRLFVERLAPDRARVRIGHGRPGVYEVHLGAVALDFDGRWTSKLTHRFTVERGAGPPRRFPQAARAFAAHRGALESPLRDQLEPGRPVRLELRVPGATGFRVRQNGAPEQRWPAKAGWLRAPFTPEKPRVWVYAELPGSEEPALVLFFGPRGA